MRSCHCPSSKEAGRPWTAYTLNNFHFEPFFGTPDSHFLNSPFALYIPKPNSKDRSNRWENLSNLDVICGTDVRSYHCPSLNKPDVHEWLILWITFTSDPRLGHQVAISRYVSALNENANDRYSSPKRELNRKDQLDIWENLSSFHNFM